MLVRYFVRLQGCPVTCAVPLPVYSSVMRTSYSSLLRSMPMYQPQLNRTDFRSFAPAAGVKGGGAGPRPRPCAGASAPAAGAAPRACALDADGTLIMRVAAMATLVPIILFREAIVISRCGLVVRVTRGDIQDAAVRPRNRLEKSQWIAVPRRDELRGQRFAD